MGKISERELELRARREAAYLAAEDAGRRVAERAAWHEERRRAEAATENGVATENSLPATEIHATINRVIKRGRGRPRKEGALSSTERSRRYRARKKGLADVRRDTGDGGLG